MKDKIDVGNAHPIKQPSRRVPPSCIVEIHNRVRDMEKRSVIRTSTSSWTSSIVLVKNKDGSNRFCVDYRKLNELTKKDSYPLPRIDNTMDAAGNFS